MKRFKKHMVLMLLTGALALLVLLPVTAQAAGTYAKSFTLAPGKIYYVVDKNISGNQVAYNSFQVVRKSSGTKYDIVYASGTASEPSGKALLNLAKNLKAAATNAYLKKSASDNTGVLLGIRVRSGSVKVTVASNTQKGAFGLSLLKKASSATPIRIQRVAKGKQINFVMGASNLTQIPLIFGGVSGTQVKRVLSASTNTYELYKFGSKSLTRVHYTQGKKDGTQTIKYVTTYTVSGKKYLCTLIATPASSVTRSSGWIQTKKGTACYGYTRDYPVVTCKVE